LELYRFVGEGGERLDDGVRAPVAHGLALMRADRFVDQSAFVEPVDGLPARDEVKPCRDPHVSLALLAPPVDRPEFSAAVHTPDAVLGEVRLFAPGLRLHSREIARAIDA